MTENSGIKIENQTAGTSNYAILTNESAGANNYALYNADSAKSYFAGNVGIGTTSPAANLDINGSATGVALQVDSGASWFLANASVTHPFPQPPGSSDSSAVQAYPQINGGDWSGVANASGISGNLQFNSIGVAPQMASAISGYFENNTSPDLHNEATIRAFGSGFGVNTAVGSEIDIGTPWRFPIDYAALCIEDQGATKYAIKTGTGIASFGGNVLPPTLRDARCQLPARSGLTA